MSVGMLCISSFDVSVVIRFLLYIQICFHLMALMLSQFHTTLVSILVLIHILQNLVSTEKNYNSKLLMYDFSCRCSLLDLLLRALR